MCESYRIVNKSNGMCLDVETGCPCSGTKVWLCQKRCGDNGQLWIVDPCDGIIRSKINSSFCLEYTCSGLVISSHGGPCGMQYCKRECDLIVNGNRCNGVLEAGGCDCSGRATVISAPLNGGCNQRWEFEPCYS